MEKSIQFDSASPLYRQLMQRIRKEIAAGVYPVHSRIPSETELGESYQVSRVTVRKALAELTWEGLLRRIQGKGTYVCAPRLHTDLREITSFHDACRMMGCEPGTRVISAQMVRPEEEIREKLTIAEDGMAVELVRLRLADDEPVMLEVNVFPAKYAYLLNAPLNGSLYQLLNMRGVAAADGVHEISLCYATPQQAKLLGVEVGTALMQLNQLIFDQHGTPLHTSHQVIRGDRFTFRI